MYPAQIPILWIFSAHILLNYFLKHIEETKTKAEIKVLFGSGAKFHGQ